MAVSVERYTVSSKTLIGRITPFFLRGGRLVKFLAAICSPLDSLNKAFQSWAYNALVDAATTSQAIVLKWSLKCKLSQYFLNKDDEFEIDTYDRSNYATFYEDEAEYSGVEVKQIYMPEDINDKLKDNIDTVILRDRGELDSESNEVLIVAPPHNIKITKDQYLRKIKQHVETYLVYDVEYRIVISKNNKQ